MVRILSSCMVLPLEPTPRKVMPLSLSDQVQPWTHMPLIAVYEKSMCNTSGLETLKQSLSSALVDFYPYAARLYMMEHGLYFLDCNAKGAQLLEAEIDESLEEFGDFGPTNERVLKELILLPDYSRPIYEYPVLILQFTRFKCGGCTLGVALCHAVADGTASTQFLNSWANIARGQKIDVLPFLDRTRLTQEYYKSYSGPIFKHEEFEPLPLVVGSHDSAAERMKETCIAMLKLTKYQIDQLKNEANEDVAWKNSTQHPYSRFEVVTAHIWKSLCKARGGSKDQLTKVRFPYDIRHKILPPLPEGYLGNATISAVTPKCLLNDIASKPLSYAAGKIREASERLTNEYVDSYLYSLASRREEMSKMRSNIHIQGTAEGAFVGNPNMMVASWIHMPSYEIDFGWGKPIYAGSAMLYSEGLCLIVPGGPKGDGSLLVPIRLQTKHMDAFKTYFYENLAVHKEDIERLIPSKI